MTNINIKIKNARAMIALLASLAAIVAFSIDIYLPLVPVIQKEFSATTFSIQLALSLFFLTFALCQLGFGLVADIFGKRQVLLFGLLVYAVGSLVCFSAVSIAMFIVGRMIQAMGAGAVILVSLALVRDFFEGQENLKAYAYVTLSITTAPAIAPPIGSYLAVFFHWRGVFAFLIILSLIFFAISYQLLPYTPVAKKIKPGCRVLLSQYGQVCRTPNYFRYLLGALLTMMILMTFIAGSPFLLMLVLKQSAQSFAWLFALNALVLMLSSFSVSRLSRRVSVEKFIRAGAVFVIIGAGIMLLGANQGVWWFILPMLVVSVGIALLMSSTLSAIMMLFQNLTAQAAALTGCLRYLTATVTALLVVLQVGALPWVMPLMMLFGGIVILFL